MCVHERDRECEKGREICECVPHTWYLPQNIYFILLFTLYQTFSSLLPNPYSLFSAQPHFLFYHPFFCQQLFSQPNVNIIKQIDRVETSGWNAQGQQAQEDPIPPPRSGHRTDLWKTPFPLQRPAQAERTRLGDGLGLLSGFATNSVIYSTALCG